MRRLFRIDLRFRPAHCSVVGFALALAACSETKPVESWSVVFSELDAALLSVGGTAADDVWIVGADAGDGPMILAWNGTAWERQAAQASGDLWWVHAGSEAVWMSGEQGMVLRYDRADDSFAALPIETAVTLFGIFAFGPSDVWAVGGAPNEQSGAIYRHDGTAWTQLDVPAEVENVSFFKVWGDTPDDVWIVGVGGVALHWDGAALAPVPVPLGRPLFTVHGRGSDVYAVGGFGSGLIVRADGAALSDVTPMGSELVPQLNGVFVSDEGPWAAGAYGAIWSDAGDGWTAVGDTPVIVEDYHSIYVDPEGGVWAVGGNVVAEPLRNGVLAHLGPDVTGGWNG